MVLSYVGMGIAALGGIGIIFIGLRYLLAPAAMAPTFGLPSWPGADAVSWLRLKGVRDIGSGLLIFVIIAAGQPQLLGWYLLVAAFVPLGDAAVILKHSGSKVLAYSVHGATAVVMILCAGLLQLS